MSHTTTLDSRPGWPDVLAASLQRIGRALRMPAPAVPEAGVELLRLAQQYESSQPSYAADLRAAALQSMGQRDD